MARSGRRTRTVRTAEKLTFCRSSEYSNILQSTAGRSEGVAQTSPTQHCAPRAQRGLCSQQESLPEELIKRYLCIRIKSVSETPHTSSHRCSALLSHPLCLLLHGVQDRKSCTLQGLQQLLVCSAQLRTPRHSSAQDCLLLHTIPMLTSQLCPIPAAPGLLQSPHLVGWFPPSSFDGQSLISASERSG